MKRLNRNLHLQVVLAFFATTHTIGFANSDERYHVDIRNAPVGDAIRLLAKMQNLNVIVPDGTNGKTNANFPSIKMHDALSAVLGSNDLGAIVENNVVRVSSKKNLEDRGEDLRTKTILLKYAKAEKLAPQVKLLLTLRGSVMFDQRTNSVTIRDTGAGLASAVNLINAIDKIDKQVLIEARIVEGSDNYLRNLGIQWGINSNSGPLAVNGLSKLGTSADGRPFMVNAPSNSATSGIALTMKNLPAPFDQLFLDTQITADEQKGLVSMLSRPSIVTMNNQAATIRSGAKFYVKTAGALNISSGTSSASGSAAAGAAAGSGGAGSTGLQEISSGITLVVTPQVTADNKINLAIKVTQSTPDFAQAVDGIPAIVENNADTTVLLENGETTIIGGLFQKSVSNQQGGIPFLNRIPIIGWLFGNSANTNKKKELIIFLTPKLIAEGSAPASQGEAERTDKEITSRLLE